MTAKMPGDVLLERINGLGLTQMEFGTRCSGIHWATLNRYIKGHDPITPQVAILFGKMFSTTPQYWLYLQADWDLQKHFDDLAQPKVKLHAKQAAIVSRTKVFE